MDVNEEVLQNLAQDNYGLDLNGALRLATGLNLDANGISQRLVRQDVNGSSDVLVRCLSTRALLLPGVSGAWCSTPDVAALDLTGDIDIRFEGIGWGTEIFQTLVGKWHTSANRSYAIRSVFGLPRLAVSANGTAEILGDLATPTITYPALRFTRVAASGVITAFQSPTIDGTWTQIGQNTTTTGAMFSGTAALGIGAGTGGTTELFQGRVTRVEVRSVIDGTIVANPDFRALAPGTTSFADGTGKTWTVHGTASVV